MKAEELRIGSWYRFYDTERQFDLLDMRAFATYIMQGADIKKEINPIPLTEEWLIPNDDYGYYKQADGSYSLVVDFGVYLGNMKYVHQLQNLYFALKGKELKETGN